LAASVVFYLVSNFGVWLQGKLYAMTWEGLGACYLAALPFFKNMLAGNAVYALVLFGGFALAQRYIGALQEPASLLARD
jgi:hypothetical protein